MSAVALSFRLLDDDSDPTADSYQGSRLASVPASRLWFLHIGPAAYLRYALQLRRRDYPSGRSYETFPSARYIRVLASDLHL
jgi:hypothetical protein